MILKCNCAHPFQDETYGRGMRVQTLGKNNNGMVKAKCTVCGHVTQVSVGKPDSKKEQKND